MGRAHVGQLGEHALDARLGRGGRRHLRLTRGRDAVAHHDGERLRPAGNAGHRSGRRGVLVARVEQSAVGDERHRSQLRLVAVGCGAAVAASGAVTVGERVVATVGARPLERDRSRDGHAVEDRLRHLEQWPAAALTEPIRRPDRCRARGARPRRPGHTRVLGLIALAFSTNSMRSHIPDDSRARSR